MKMLKCLCQSMANLLASSCNAGLWKMSNGLFLVEVPVYILKCLYQKFCELDICHDAVYCIFIIRMSFKAYCRGMQGIYANEVWWLLWSPRISSVNSLYGMMHTLVMMSPSVQCACVKQLGWGFFLLCIFKFFFLQ